MKGSVIDDQRTGAVHLSAGELQRYSRHLIMPEVTAEGQRRLKAARVLCIGAGGLGSPAALYLAAAGVGTIGIVDFDEVDLSNLQRQILHGTKDIGRGKLESAQDRLRDINPEIEIELHQCRFSSENATQIVSEYDIVVDGSDNFATRYLSNDVCVFLTWAGRATAAFFRSRLHQTPCRTARKRACSVFCQGSSGCCKRLRRSN